MRFSAQHETPDEVWMLYDEVEGWSFSFNELTAHGRRYYARKGRNAVRMVPAGLTLTEAERSTVLAAARAIQCAYPDEWRVTLHEDGCVGTRYGPEERDDEKSRCDGDHHAEVVDAALAILGKEKP